MSEEKRAFAAIWRWTVLCGEYYFLLDLGDDVGVLFALPGKTAGLALSIMRMIGVLFILLALWLWVGAVFGAKVDEHIKNDQLVTDGVYAWVRNPIYSAFLFLCTGALCLYGNGWLLILPIVYWAFLTVLLKNTEERWLTERYGDAYRHYQSQVDRCLPHPPRR